MWAQVDRNYGLDTLPQPSVATKEPRGEIDSANRIALFKKKLREICRPRGDRISNKEVVIPA